MIKKGIFAVALLSMMLVVAQVQAADLGTGTIKIDSNTYQNYGMDSWPDRVWWPYEYKAVTLCTIPVYIEVGMFAQMKECDKAKIVLKQKNCSEIGKGGGDYPCYKGCTDVKIRGNFEMKLGTNLSKAAIPAGYPNAGKNVLQDWSATLTPDVLTPGTTPADGDGYMTTQLCVIAWKANIWYATGNYSAGPFPDGVTPYPVGYVAITVKPNQY